MSRIDERLEALQVDTSGMTTEQKFTAATGLTHYDEETASNDWYVPGGAANVVVESDEQGGGSQGGGSDEQPQVYTAKTAADYNAELDGAVKAGDVQTAAQTVTTESDSYDYIYDKDSWDDSYANGGLKKYYVWSDAANAPYKEDLWNTVENRAANINDAKKDPDTNEYVLDENGNYIYDENCKRSWQGAVNAPGAKYPWIVPYFDEDVNATITFQYEGKEDVKPWSDTTFGTGEHKSFGCASVPVELGNEFLLENGETTFDISKFKMMLETEEPEILYTEETAAEYNATLDGAVKAGDPIVSTAEIQTEP